LSIVKKSRLKCNQQKFPSPSRGPSHGLAAISQTGEVHRDPGSEKIVL
jgi:hypothetical protein